MSRTGRPRTTRNAPRPHPRSFWADHPRLLGALLVSFASALIAAQVAMKVTTHRALCATPVFLFYGLWALVVGAPKDPSTGETAGWAAVGGWLAGLLGMIASIVIATMLD